MNASTEHASLELVDQEKSMAQLPSIQQAGAVSFSKGEAFMLALMDRKLDFDQIERAMDLKDRMDAKTELQLFNEAFSGFKAEAVVIAKNTRTKNGPLEGRMYADKFAVVNAVSGALSRHGLSSTWKRTKDEKDWIEVTCYLRHVGGHVETVTQGGPPDAGGAKNPMQARQSTESYLQRYTLLAILGLAEGGDDDDGNGGDASDPLLDEFQAAAMEGTAALRARYEKSPPPDAFWAHHAKSLKAAAKKADEAAQ